MKSTNKQSQKIGGLVTREVALGADGPITVSLSDNIILIDESGKQVIVPACKIITALTFDTGLLAKLQDQVSQLSSQLTRLNTIQDNINTLRHDLDKFKNASIPADVTPLAPVNMCCSPTSQCNASAQFASNNQVDDVVETANQPACIDCNCEQESVNVAAPNNIDIAEQVPFEQPETISAPESVEQVVIQPLSPVAKIIAQMVNTPDQKPSIPIASEKAPDRPKQRGRARKQ